MKVSIFIFWIFWIFWTSLISSLSAFHYRDPSLFLTKFRTNYFHGHWELQYSNDVNNKFIKKNKITIDREGDDHHLVIYNDDDALGISCNNKYLYGRLDVKYINPEAKRVKANIEVSSTSTSWPLIIEVECRDTFRVVCRGQGKFYEFHRVRTGSRTSHLQTVDVCNVVATSVITWVVTTVGYVLYNCTHIHYQ